jgi:hypothetical protein
LSPISARSAEIFLAGDGLVILIVDLLVKDSQAHGDLRA